MSESSMHTGTLLSINLMNPMVVGGGDPYCRYVCLLSVIVHVVHSC